MVHGKSRRVDDTTYFGLASSLVAQARVGGGLDPVAFARLDLHQRPLGAVDLAAVAGHLDFPGEDEDEGALVHLVLLEALPRRQVERDDAGVLARGEDLRQARLQVQLVQVPALHPIAPFPSPANVPGQTNTVYPVDPNGGS